jgi:hypothetical protein
MNLRRTSIVLLLLALIAPLATPRANTQAGTPIWFPETGHMLAYGFREFYDRHGGLPIFGYPLTEVFVEDGRPVQYFERARLEWHGRLTTSRWAIWAGASSRSSHRRNGQRRR